MRVTTNSYSETLIRQLQKLNTEQSSLQNQVATGQKISLPEDDPTAMSQVLNLQSSILSSTQYQSNITSLKQTSTAAYSAIDGLKTISDRVQEIAVLASDSTKSAEDLRSYGIEVSELLKQAVQFANTKYDGEYLFAGTASDTAPFTTTTDAEGNITAVTYSGNTSVREVDIASNSRASNAIVGANTTGAGAGGLITDSTTGADFFAHVISLQEHLFAGDSASISATDVPALKKDEENIISHIAGIGALQARLETAKSSHADQVENAEASVTDLAGADLTTTIVRLSESQTALQAAMQSGAKLLNQSLMDYLS